MRYHGRISHGGFFINSNLKTALADGSLRLPPPKPLAKPLGGNWHFCALYEAMSYVFAGDSALLSSENYLKS